MSLEIRNVHLAAHPSSPLAKRLFTIRCEAGLVDTIEGSQHGDGDDDGRTGRNVDVNVGVLDGRGGLLLPSLCHAHIHLDKCYILEEGGPLHDSSFSAALAHTAHQKRLFPLSPFSSSPDSLYARGARLICESVQAGVTAMRAHVEVDDVVGTACVEVGVRLKEEWREVCDIRLCLFMQEPLFDAPQPDFQTETKVKFNANASHLLKALSSYAPGTFSALGSAPYVEPDLACAHANINHIFSLANEHKLHVDFHLDYNLGEDEGLSDEEVAEGKGAMVWHVLERVKEGSMDGAKSTVTGEQRTLTLGHLTRLTRFSHQSLIRLCALISSLPVLVHLVALPQSDVYMMGRRERAPYDAKRGTLDVVRLVREYGDCETLAEGARGLSIAMSVNNVQNAFTPQGNVDPLGLCPLGVGLYQAGGEDDAGVLLEAVSLTSHLAVGVSRACVPRSLVPSSGDAASFVILHGNATRWGAALAPGYERTTVYRGRVVGWRRVSSGVGAL